MLGYLIALEMTRYNYSSITLKDVLNTNGCALPSHHVRAAFQAVGDTAVRQSIEPRPLAILIPVFSVSG